MPKLKIALAIILSTILAIMMANHQSTAAQSTDDSQTAITLKVQVVKVNTQASTITTADFNNKDGIVLQATPKQLGIIKKKLAQNSQTQFEIKIDRDNNILSVQPIKAYTLSHIMPFVLGVCLVILSFLIVKQYITRKD